MPVASVSPRAGWFPCPPPEDPAKWKWTARLQLQSGRQDYPQLEGSPTHTKYSLAHFHSIGITRCQGNYLQSGWQRKASVTPGSHVTLPGTLWSPDVLRISTDFRDTPGAQPHVRVQSSGRTQTLLQKDSDHDLKYSSPCLLQAFHKRLLANGCGQRKALSQPMPPGAFSQIASMVVLRVLPWLVTASTQQQHSPSSTGDSQQGGVPVSQLALLVPLQCCGMSLHLQHQVGYVIKKGLACSNRQGSLIPQDLT